MEVLKIEDKTKYLLEVLKRIDSYVMWGGGRNLGLVMPRGPGSHDTQQD